MPSEKKELDQKASERKKESLQLSLYFLHMGFNIFPTVWLVGRDTQLQGGLVNSLPIRPLSE